MRHGEHCCVLQVVWICSGKPDNINYDFAASSLCMTAQGQCDRALPIRAQIDGGAAPRTLQVDMIQ